MKYKHIFFDLDHTLWDFHANSRVALEHLFHEHGLGERSVKSLAHFLEVYEEVNRYYWFLYHNKKVEKERLRNGRFEDTLRKIGIEDERLAGTLASRYLELSPRQQKLIPGSMEVLDYLRERGYGLHLITNGFVEVQRIKIANSGLAPYFDEVIISEEVGVQKPMREVFDLLLDRLGITADQALMVGDNLETDVEGARRAGIDQVWFNPERERSGKHRPTFTIKQLEELKRLL